MGLYERTAEQWHRDMLKSQKLLKATKRVEVMEGCDHPDTAHKRKNLVWFSKLHATRKHDIFNIFKELQ